MSSCLNNFKEIGAFQLIPLIPHQTLNISYKIILLVNCFEKLRKLIKKISLTSNSPRKIEKALHQGHLEP